MILYLAVMLVYCLIVIPILIYISKGINGWLFLLTGIFLFFIHDRMEKKRKSKWNSVIGGIALLSLVAAAIKAALFCLEGMGYK